MSSASQSYNNGWIEMSDVAYLAAAYAAMIGLIGWFTWQLLDRLKDVQARIEAVEESLSNPTDSDE
ncbi:MAG: hypothetical protein P8Q90_06765 [Candidatus Thalassarchaeaceae archaeon]|nr:hypothetical protein [Candidatus Thalassarchaeaceae archaeon]